MIGNVRDHMKYVRYDICHLTLELSGARYARPLGRVVRPAATGKYASPKPKLEGAAACEEQQGAADQADAVEDERSDKNCSCEEKVLHVTSHENVC